MKRFIYIFTVVLCTFIVRPCICQVVMEWQAHYLGPGNGDFTTSMTIDWYGNVYITGRSSNTINSSDYATLKYSSSGVELWVARYGGQPNRGAAAYSVAADRFGNAYVTGAAPVSSYGPIKYTTIKYNEAGEQCWVQIFYGQYYYSVDEGLSITTDDTANVYVTGISFSTNSGADYTTIKYDSSGSQQWVAYYDGSHGQDWAKLVRVDNLGNVYVTGSSHGDTTNYDIATVKYIPFGVQQWAARYNGPGNGGDSAAGLAVDNNGNVYVTGRSWGGDSTGYDYVTIKYNQSGVQQWARRFDGLGNYTDIPHSIAVDDSGNVYVTGEMLVNPNDIQFATIKYNPDGVQQWVAFYVHEHGDRAYALALDKYGGVYVTGASWGGLFGTRSDFATVKYSAAGVQQWVIRTSGSVDEVPRHIAVDSLGNVYVAGNDGHYLTIKYNQITGIGPVSNELPNEFKLSQNYPNPFNPSTRIKFDTSPLPSPKGRVQSVRLVIYDILGREIAVLVNEELKPGSYEVEWDASNFPSGVYFYKLISGEYTETKKMILLK